MKMIRVFGLGWIGGWIAGLVMAERWRRMGADPVYVVANLEYAVETDASSPVERSSAMSNLSAVVISGVKADYARSRHLLGRVAPWTSSSVPSFADLNARATASTSAGSTARTGPNHSSNGGSSVSPNQSIPT